MMYAENYSCQDGIAVPINPIDLSNPPICFDPIEEQKQMLKQQRLFDEFEQFAQQHTYATDAPDGSYSADCFELKTFGCKLTDLDDLPGCKCGYLLPEAKLCPHSMKELKFKGLAKEAEITTIGRGIIQPENPKFGEWISIKTKLPTKETVVLTYKQSGSIISDQYNGEHFGWEDFNERTVTHWMPLPSPPKTL